MPPAAQEMAAPQLAAIAQVQASSDKHLIAIWLHGHSARTQRAYRADLAVFLAHVRLPLREITPGDVQGYQDTLASLTTASQARRLGSIKSLLSFGHKAGYLPVNVGAAIRLPKIK